MSVVAQHDASNDAQEWLAAYFMATEDPPRFYLLTINHGFAGNACLWWRLDGCGYTTDINDAGLYDEAKARGIESNGFGTVAVPEAEVKAAARLYVHADKMGAHVRRAREEMRSLQSRRITSDPQRCAHPGCGRFVTSKRSPDEMCPEHRG